MSPAANWEFTRNTFSSKIADAVPRIHPADRPSVESAIRKVISGETDHTQLNTAC
jgi:hypothetical protein